jgi:hypothetical protein
MELIAISRQIIEKETMLIKWRNSLDNYAENSANKTMEYEKQMALTLMGLRNGRTYEIEDKEGDLQTVTDPPVTIMEKIAKGICCQEKMEADLAESKFKNAHTKVKAMMAELNALQTIHRHID